MYHIAICDDDNKFIAFLKRMLLTANTDKNIELKIHEFYSGEELCIKLDGSVHYDLLILDMELGGMDGDETARIFRSQFPNSVLAFCSGVRQPTIESFKATPFRYIDKNCTDDDFIKTLKEILEEVKRVAEEPYILGHYKWTERKVKLKDILYIQTAKRGSEIILCPKSKEVGIEDKILSKKKPEELSQELNSKGFALVQSACLVNMDHIGRIGVDEVVLDNNEILSVARAYKNSFRDAFTKRYADKY